MLSIPQALARILPAFEPRGTERCELLAARGRFLATRLIAEHDAPPFDNSAMDGYAIRAQDVARVPVTLPVASESRAGGPLPPPLKPGQACRIFTGAVMPEGADAVVMQEDTEARDGDIEIKFESKSGKHVRKQGSDTQAGATLLDRGACLGSGEIGLLASQNLAEVEVFRRPTVAILSTGDELVELGEPAGPGTIYNSNAYALAAQVDELGAEAVRFPIVRDDIDSLVAALRQALQHDVVLTTGGVSVGQYDFMHQAFEATGIEIDFWKVAIKPGKPFLFAHAGDVPVIGLPGNPVSVIVTFEMLVAPGIRRMLGDPQPYRHTLSVRLAAAYKRRPGRVEIARAQLHKRDGQWWADLKSLQGSGSLPSVAGATAWVILPSDRAEIGAGEEVRAFVWDRGFATDAPPFDGS